ncbi:FAD-dependent oxidoreductase [Planobispora takensis]|uniref:FAD-dependent oxidoreductase n=2 Tax=Planobispora takensis TaxID=1367882 RepID=A0A8J3WUW8_9ACTN|nr:FAD-dependent oxidoreductase [Planobispora takensis]
MENIWAAAPRLRPPLDGPAEADVAVVGAGYTGLWAAYHLKRLAPSLEVVVLEAEHAGYGASGRNGGWCSAELPVEAAVLARRHGRAAAEEMRRAAGAALDGIEAVLRAEGIDCDWHRGGTLYLARNRPQLRRLLAAARSRPDGWSLLTAGQARARLRAEGVLGAAHTPHCARLHPGKLVRGLAEAVERLGVTVHEGTRVVEARPGLVRTVSRGGARTGQTPAAFRRAGGPAGGTDPRIADARTGSVRARYVLVCTEGYTPGSRVLTLTSCVAATEPLPAPVWAELGWRGRETVADLSRLFPYMQRTADDRIVIGGCGAGYGEAPYDHAALRDRLVGMFPVLREAAITHRWSGVLGLHRRGEPSVHLDPATGLGYAGGYGGDGVTLAYLAGGSLAALVTGADVPEARLAWTRARAGRWEPEPLRALGVRAVLACAAGADRHEERTGRPAPLRGAICSLFL